MSSAQRANDISEREVIVAIVAHLGLPTEAPLVARARSPAFELASTTTARAGPRATTSRRRTMPRVRRTRRLGARWGDFSVVSASARRAREGSWLRDRPNALLEDLADQRPGAGEAVARYPLVSRPREQLSQLSRSARIGFGVARRRCHGSFRPAQRRSLSLERDVAEDCPLLRPRGPRARSRDADLAPAGRERDHHRAGRDCAHGGAPDLEHHLSSVRPPDPAGTPKVPVAAVTS